MIKGIGSDLCAIPRMRRAVENDYFVRRVFAREEIEYATSRAEPARHFASAFAAREAFAKASGLGIFGVGLGGAWVRRTKNGPVLMLSGELRSKPLLAGTKCWLSLSHDGGYAMAFVVLEDER